MGEQSGCDVFVRHVIPAPVPCLIAPGIENKQHPGMGVVVIYDHGVSTDKPLRIPVRHPYLPVSPGTGRVNGGVQTAADIHRKLLVAYDVLQQRRSVCVYRYPLIASDKVPDNILRPHLGSRNPTPVGVRRVMVVGYDTFFMKDFHDITAKPAAVLIRPTGPIPYSPVQVQRSRSPSVIMTPPVETALQIVYKTGSGKSGAGTGPALVHGLHGKL